MSNLFKRETLSGEFLQVNSALVTELKAHGLWTGGSPRGASSARTARCRASRRCRRRSRDLFRTAWELPQRALIDMAAARAPFIDQSQSLNLFVAAPTIGKLSSMYLHAWKTGLKTTYYLRSRPATRIAQATVSIEVPGAADVPEPAGSDTAAVVCSLENPETCEACQ